MKNRTKVLIVLFVFILLYGLCRLCLDVVAWTSKPNENYLQIAKGSVQYFV